MTAAPASIRGEPGRYRLYWAAASAAMAPELVLEEAGLEYEKVPLDLGKGEQRDPTFLAVNPLGFVPALVLPEGGVVTESAAIVLYLCDRHDLFLAPAADEADRAPFLRALLTLTNGPQASYKRYYYPARFSTDEADAPRIKERAYQAVTEQWRQIDALLAEGGGPFFLGPRFSAADLYLAMLVCWYRERRKLVEELPAVGRCFRETAARPVVERVMTAQGELPL